MWQMIAGPNLRCIECRHTIQTGRLCLSDLPEETPPGIERRNFRHFCIGCPQCWAQGKHACYLRHLDAQRPTGTVPRNLPCARCGVRIKAGDKAGIDIYYDWPEAAEAVRTSSLSSIVGRAVAVTGADILIRGVPSNSFTELSKSLQIKFARAGLGSDRGVRNIPETQHFYQDTIPYPIRNLGEGAVQRFLVGKEASHIQSVYNAPHLVVENTNFAWERASLNRARGPEDMTGAQLSRTQATNAFNASAIVFRDCLQSAAIAGFYAAMMEAPVAALENYIHYRKGRKTGEQAIMDAAELIVARAATGAIIGFAVTAVVALIPGAPVVLATVSPILMTVGFALYGTSALKRVLDALADDLPLNHVGTYFCSPRCHTKFAYENGLSALMRWDANRISRATT